MTKSRWFSLLFVPLVVMAMQTVACGGDDDEEATGATGSEALPGAVEEKPADAKEVDVTLKEWAIQTGQPSVAAGKVYFKVDNAGPDDAHEFLIIRTDLGPLDLPFVDDKVDEDQLDVVDEIEEFAPDSSASITVDLTPGKYVFICNISEIDNGEVESHYKKGMVATFTVE